MNYYNENDPKAAAWLRELIREGLISEGVVDERSIVDVNASDLADYCQCHFFAGIGGWSYALRLAGVSDDEPIWTGSCPCQPFADCGQRKGFADERHLWPQWFRLIREQNPTTILGEQVASNAALEWLDIVFADLEKENYACGSADLCAAGIGSPQIRPRLWWMADSNNTGWQRAEWNGKSYQARKEWPSSCSQSLRSTGGLWPPGPGEIGRVPVLANGLPGTMGRCRGYGNAIVPQVAAAFVTSCYEALHDVRSRIFLKKKH